MPFVADSSIVACWILADESDPAAEAALTRLAVDSAVAPRLCWWETRNVLIVAERRGRLDPAKTADALRLLAGYPLTFDAGGDEAVLMQVARRRGLTVYDAAYLELALRLRCPLATLDRALAKAARAEGAALIGEGAA
jgi:predicted nucleic acid-binding protein